MCSCQSADADATPFYFAFVSLIPMPRSYASFASFAPFGLLSQSLFQCWLCRNSLCKLWLWTGMPLSSLDRAVQRCDLFIYDIDQVKHGLWTRLLWSTVRHPFTYWLSSDSINLNRLARQKSTEQLFGGRKAKALSPYGTVSISDKIGRGLSAWYHDGCTSTLASLHAHCKKWFQLRLK